MNEAYYGYNGSGDWWLYSEPRVKPGDTILVHAGLYKGERYKYANPLGLDFHGTYVLTQDGTAERPITIKAAGDGEVIFDGEGNYRLFDVMAADHHYFEGLTIVNTEIAFYAGLKRVLGCSGLSVVNCRMDKVGQGVMTHWAKSNDFYIADNTMIGMHDRTRVHGWARVEDPAPITSYNAVKVYGQGHVVCHNYIAYYHDAITIDTHGRPEGGPGEHCASIDIYNNDIFVMADNFIEADGGAHNIRIYNNRGVNVYHSALSGQPVFGGPAYYIRNIVHTSGDGLKFSARPAGLVVYNNTFCTETRVRQYSNGQFRNNLFLGHLPDQPTLSSMSYTSYTSFDYNGYRIKPEAKPLFQWAQPTDRLQDFTLTSRGTKDGPGGGTQWFQSLEAFSAATGQEQNGVMLDYDVFEGVAPLDPQDRSRVYRLEELDFRLREGSAAVDAGCELPTLTDGFTGEAPDLGAYERGKPLPSTASPLTRLQLLRLIPQAVRIVQPLHLAQQQSLEPPASRRVLWIARQVHLIGRRSVLRQPDNVGLVVLRQKLPWILTEMKQLRLPHRAFQHVVLDELPGTLLHAAHARLGAAGVDAVQHVADSVPLSFQDRLEAHSFVRRRRFDAGQIAHRGQYVGEVDVPLGA